MMKKIIVLALLTLTIVGFSSCEKRCICKYLDDGYEEVIYNAYSKKECRDWESYLTNDLNINSSCDYKVFK